MDWNLIWIYFGLRLELKNKQKFSKNELAGLVMGTNLLVAVGTASTLCHCNDFSFCTFQSQKLN